VFGQIKFLLTDEAQNLVLSMTCNQRPWKIDEERHEKLNENVGAVKLDELLSHERFPA